jgi:hypothetical protein
MSRKPVNNSSLALAIEQKRLQADDRQILSRSQQELELANLAVLDLQKERKALEVDLNGVQKNIVDLNMLHDRLTGQMKDVETLLKAKLDTVNSLQQAGVSIQ